jgi:hypothetical protein
MMKAATSPSARTDPLTNVRLTVHRATREIRGNCPESTPSSEYQLRNICPLTRAETIQKMPTSVPTG